MSIEQQTPAAAGSPVEQELGPVGWRYVPSDAWGGQVLTQDPKTAQLALDMGREVEPLYTEAQMLARVAAERERWQTRVEQAFRDGYWARETYNDSEVSDADAKWASAKAGLLRA